MIFIEEKNPNSKILDCYFNGNRTVGKAIEEEKLASSKKVCNKRFCRVWYILAVIFSKIFI